MEKIITLQDCIKKETHIWIRKIKTKFLVLDPRVMKLDEITAKNQLFYLIYDPADGKKSTMPYYAERCIDGVPVQLERMYVIGEPTLDTLIDWSNIYGNESVFKSEIDSNRKLILKNQIKTHGKEIEEKYYDAAFIWNDQGKRITRVICYQKV